MSLPVEARVIKRIATLMKKEEFQGAVHHYENKKDVIGSDSFLLFELLAICHTKLGNNSTSVEFLRKCRIHKRACTDEADFFRQHDSVFIYAASLLEDMMYSDLLDLCNKALSLAERKRVEYTPEDIIELQQYRDIASSELQEVQAELLAAEAEEEQKRQKRTEKNQAKKLKRRAKKQQKKEGEGKGLEEEGDDEEERKQLQEKEKHLQEKEMLKLKLKEDENVKEEEQEPKPKVEQVFDGDELISNYYFPLEG